MTVQVSGDCKDSVCDGLGGVTTMDNNGDAPAPTNQCMTPACSAGNVTLTPKPHGTTCSQNDGRTCNGSGACQMTFDVVRVGVGGTTALANIATTAYIEEHVLASGGALVGNALQLPTADSGLTHAFSLSGTATSDGQLTLSGDGKYVVVGGYNRMPGLTGNVVNMAATTVPRMVARVDATNAIDTSSLFGNAAFSGNNLRGVTTTDGMTFWGAGAGGANAGIWVLPIGQQTATQIFSTAIRWLGIYPGPNDASNPNPFPSQLYGTGANNPLANVFTAGTTSRRPAHSARPGCRGCPCRRPRRPR